MQRTQLVALTRVNDRTDGGNRDVIEVISAIPIDWTATGERSCRADRIE